MMLTPASRLRLYGTVAGLVAIWLGLLVARGDLLLPSLVAAVLTAVIVARVQPVPLIPLMLGFLLFGYFAGNRGFAQLTLVAGLPLLPGEAVLLVAGGILLWQSARTHTLPVRADPLNLTILAWMIVGAARVAFDLRAHGLMALRDFATIYYASYFFVAQAAARDPASHRFLLGTLRGAAIALLPIYGLFTVAPEFFVNTLTVRGAPLVFFKDDLAGTFLAAGAVLFYFRHEETGRWWPVGLSLTFSAATIATSNRASMLGLLAATAWLALRRRWRFAVLQAAGAAVAIVAVLLGAAALEIPWQRTPVYGLYERVASLADPAGNRTYVSLDSANKGDNNRFRLIWWRAVVDETIAGNPYVGLGFGYDLADRFRREYYPEDNDDFTARSPHNILLTIFGRMGLVGLATFLAVVTVLARKTWQALGAMSPAVPLWCAGWTILVSACFGVVLEGPMGAIVFWILIGLAHGQAQAVADETASHAALPTTE